jgi:hypothetical protein
LALAFIVMRRCRRLTPARWLGPAFEHFAAFSFCRRVAKTNPRTGLVKDAFDSNKRFNLLKIDLLRTEKLQDFTQ